MTGCVLIVDDVAVNRIILKAKLGSACYEVTATGSGLVALDMARASPPDMILMDLAPADMDGLDLCRALRADPVTARVPILVLSGPATRAQRLAALQAGAEDVLLRPVEELTLLAGIRNLLRVAQTDSELTRQEGWCQSYGFAEPPAAFEVQPRVALLGCAPHLSLFWRRQLAQFCPDVVIDTPGTAEVLGASDSAPAPDLFVLVPEQGAVSAGLRVLLDLSARRATRHSMFLAVLPRGAEAEAAMALDLGAHGVLHLPVDPEEMALRIRLLIRRKRDTDRLRAAVERGLNLAAIDPLTGLLNRRSLRPRLERLARESDRAGRGFAMLLLDLDRFKAINDTYGHAAGDRVLEAVAERLRVATGPQDILARHGGEEFLLALPDVDLPEARACAERVCRAIEAAPVDLPGGDRVSVTASVGLAICKPESRCGAMSPEWMAQRLETVVDSADKALLAAKARGRNQVTVSAKAS